MVPLPYVKDGSVHFEVSCSGTLVRALVTQEALTNHFEAEPIQHRLIDAYYAHRAVIDAKACEIYEQTHVRLVLVSTVCF
jgi:hypothetical protein